MGFTKFTVRLLSLLLASAAVLPTVSAAAIAPNFEIEERDASADAFANDFESPHLEKRQNAPPNFYPVIGHGAGVCFQRRKIQTLQANYPAHWNMFILALENLMLQSETSDYSYFSVSGIHGAPKIPWQEAPINSVPPGTYDLTRGYCTHSSVLFCTWHRPYAILLEQMLVAKARRIAEGFSGTDRTMYLQAANELRFPYWDWSDPQTQSYLPAITMQSTIQVTKPTGRVTIANPLYLYRFRSSTLRTTYFTGNFRTWDTTRRRPNSSGVSNNAEASSIMQQGFSTRRSQTYNALQQSTYNGFNSAVEGVHNGIHTNVGGDGHMSFLDVSAFDPIFWLHHVNVDRLAMMWQASHPGVYMTPAPPTRTFSRPVNVNSFPTNQDNLTTPLKPFRHSTGIFWTSMDVRDARSGWRYGYGYDEVPCSMRSQATTSQIRDFTISRINALYGPSTSLGFSSEVSSPDQEDPDNDRKTSEAEKVRVRKEYTLKFCIDHAEVDGSWNFYAFNGRPDLTSDPSSWALAPNLIGTITDLGGLVGFGAQSTSTMKKDSKLFVGDMPLTETLISKKFIVTEKQYADADKYLTKNLFWALERQGVVLDMASLKTAKVGVYEKEVTYPADENSTELPTSTDPVFVSKITKGKVSGIVRDDDMETVTLLNGAVVEVPESI